MVRVLLVLAIGVAIGYMYGFGDAKQHDQNVVARYLDRVGGDARSYSANDTDALMLKAEH
ncbi:MAG TPA: hypothetical protein VFX39_06670 [Gemmatimonadaceae bacterium]|nr:hypothetical protein [Gemmatimonadaceae bacterium]